MRYLPEGGGLVEVTNRTFQGRRLLRPGRKANAIITGAFGRAAERYPVALVALVCMSNHFHLILWVPDARVLARFMGYVKSKMARELGLLHGWTGKLWASRYKMALISSEEAAQVARLKYVLSQGAKEGLVATPLDWPGVHCAEALLTGRSLSGKWVDRTGWYRATERGGGRRVQDFVESVQLRFAPLPCWKHLSEQAYRAAVADLLAQIEDEAALYRKEAGIRLRARRQVRRRLLAVHPHTPAKPPKRTRAPRFHAASRQALEKLRAMYRAFVEAYRAAADELRRGNRTVPFPEGCFPPALPFQPFTGR